jgi:Ig-like domain-containing protein/cohesin domain-containing protein
MTRISRNFRIFTFAVALVGGCFLPKVGFGQSGQLVVPNYCTNSQLPNVAEGIFHTVSRHQVVFGAAEFPPYPIVINEIQWRPDSFMGGPASNVVITNFQINLSTTAHSADALDSAFSQNIGPDDTTVFSGTLNLSTAFLTLSNGTKAFDINVPLQNTFTYNPANGNLLVDVRNFSGSDGNIFDNGAASSSDTVSRLVTTDVNGDNGTPDTAGSVLQITFTPLALAPVVTTQPSDQVAVINGTVTFTLSVLATPPLTYQWFVNDTNHPVSGATSNSLVLNNVQTNQVGVYFAAISNSIGFTISSNASLTVLPLSITSQPTNQIVGLGDTAAFSITAQSGVPLSYQWFFNGTNEIAGATNTSLILSNVLADEIGVYSVQVTNIYGSIMSSNAALGIGLIVPNYAANFQPNGATINTLAVPCRMQTIYGADQFPAYPIIITEMRWRPDALDNGALTDNIPNLQINLSTTAATADHLNSTYANNVGTNDTMVFSGPVTFTTAFSTLTNGTKAFDIVLPLQTPFVYDATKGNLLVDARNFFGGGAASFLTSGLNTSTDSVSRMVSNDPNAITASGSDSAAEALQIGYVPAPLPPTISSQPTNRSVTAGSTMALTVVAGPPPVSYQWFLTDTNTPIAGATNASLTFSNVQTSQSGIYLVQVTGAYGVTLSSNALLSVTTDPPNITLQPVSRSGLVGTNFTFSVTATGSLPLTYQWFYNTNTLLTGATNFSLSLSNLQFSQAGTYSVIVSNAYGVTNSAFAVLTMSFPPVNVLLGSTNVMGGNLFSVPVLLVANGNENALSFSVSYDTQRLTYARIDLGSGATDASLFPNISQTNSGRVGVTMQLPQGETFVPGTQEVVRVSFQSVFVSGSPIVTPLRFTNQPIARVVFDVQGSKLATNFINGTVTLGVTDFEGDVMPRPTGDRSLDIFDWSQVGRFVAGLDTTTSASEFQRADVAPKSTGGDGQLKVTDWVQAGRYGAAIDAPSAVGGPTAAVTPTVLTGGPRTLSIGATIGIKGLNVTVPVILQSQGNENAAGFSVNFDPTILKYVSAAKGSAAASATLLLNTNQAAAGTVGVLLALQSGNSFTNGAQQEIAKLTFTALNTASNAAVTFVGGPVLRAISDPLANELAADYINNLVTINPPPTLSASVSGSNAVLSWPLWGTGFNVQATGDLLTQWTNTSYVAQTNGGNLTITIPTPAKGGYFRLQHP